jgi:hypothetical protein
VIRRLRLEWPDPRPFADRGGAPIRLLAASDDPDPGLAYESNRRAIAPIDGVIGCGDLAPDWLSFLADAFRVPLVYVRGNHDRGGEWEEPDLPVPPPLQAGRHERIAGVAIAGLEWPGVRERGNRRHPWLAWRQALAVARRLLLARLTGRVEPVLVISHAAPLGAGDAADRYHLGFPAYRWLLGWLRPPLWLHGHTTTASVPSLRVDVGRTVLVNVTGAILVELVAPGSDRDVAADGDAAADGGAGGQAEGPPSTR